jgi:hypothetical protein
MSTIVNRHALDWLLLERFGGKLGRGLAVERPRRRDNPPSARNFYLPQSSPYAERKARIVKLAPQRGIMPSANRCL